MRGERALDRGRRARGETVKELIRLGPWRRALKGAVPLIFWASWLLQALVRFEQPALRRRPHVEFEGCDVVHVRANDGVACTFPMFSIYDLPKLSESEWNARMKEPWTDPRRMTFWVAGPWADYRICADDRNVEIDSRVETSIDGGTRVTFRVDPLIKQLELKAPDGAVLFTLPIVAEETPPGYDALNEVMAKWRSDRRAAADKLPALFGSPSAAVRARALALFGRFEKNEGQIDAAAVTLLEALAAGAEAGLVSDQVATGIVLANILIEDRRDFMGANDALDRIEPLLEEFPVGRAIAPQWRALLSYGVGDFHKARGLFELSEKKIARLNLSGHMNHVQQKLMVALELLGQHAKAAEYRSKVEEGRAEGGLCQSAQRATTLGWHHILSGEPESAKKYLDVALDLLSAKTKAGKAGCDDAIERSNVQLNLAHIALDAGELDEASAHLTQAAAESPDPPPRLAVWSSIYAGRLSLASGHPDQALFSFDDAMRFGAEAHLQYPAVTAAYHRAEAIANLGIVDETIAAYAVAEGMLNRWSDLVPLGAGKQIFFGKHSSGIHRYIDLLIEEGELEMAADVARRNLTRIPASVELSHRLQMASSDEYAAWVREVQTASMDDVETTTATGGASPSKWAGENRTTLLTPGADEAILVYHPIGYARPGALAKEEDWAGFFVTRKGVTAKRIEVPPHWLVRPEEADSTRRAAAKVLLDPFADELAQLESTPRSHGKPVLRLVPAESMSLFPLHRLPWKKSTLEERFSVVYAVDLPVRGHADESPRAPSASAKVALLVVNPRLDLTGAAGEADAVEVALRKRGWEVRRLGGADATLDAMSRELTRPDVELLHYIGHGNSKDLDGWDDTLDLASGEHLSVTDVLKLPRAPRNVTLSACKGAASRTDAHVQGMNLANAFIIVGARTVVASRVDVNDSAAAEVMGRLYDRTSNFFESPTIALQEALEPLDNRSRADFRVLEP